MSKVSSSKQGYHVEPHLLPIWFFSTLYSLPSSVAVLHSTPVVPVRCVPEVTQDLWRISLTTVLNVTATTSLWTVTWTLESAPTAPTTQRENTARDASRVIMAIPPGASPVSPASVPRQRGATPPPVSWTLTSNPHVITAVLGTLAGPAKSVLMVSLATHW